MNALVVAGLVRRFGGVAAVDGVDLRLGAGERRAIIGPNGAGKTTLFNLLTGTLLPTAGNVWLFGQNITRLQPYRRAKLRLGRTFQVTSLMRGLTVFDNALLAIQAGEPFRWSPYISRFRIQDWRERTSALLATWHLSEMSDRLVDHLSHGAQRQLEIVLALARSPSVLLLDEPTQGLSPAETGAVSDAIGKIGRDITILMIEHDLAVAFGFADLVTVMHQGKILIEGTPADVRANAEVSKIYFGSDESDDLDNV